ncbi:hypothetical protein Aperf_G00000088560 [Anoplocephala perfoliata]
MDQTLGFINVTFPPKQNVPIGLHELSEYLLCACAFFNFLLAFFSDRDVPPAHMLLLTPLIRPEDQPVDFDLIATDDKPPISTVKIKDGTLGNKSKEPETTLCPEKYVSFPSRVTFFWVTKLIMLGYRNTLQLDHLWALESKNLSVTVVPRFLRNVFKYLRVDISDELNLKGPTQDSTPSISGHQKSAIVNPNPNAVSRANNTADKASSRRSTFADFGSFEENTDEMDEASTGVKGKGAKKQRTMLAAPDISKKSAILEPTTFLLENQGRDSGLSSIFKCTTSSKKGDVETGLLGSDLPKATRNDSSDSGKMGTCVKKESRQVNCGLVKALAHTYGFRLFIAGVFKFAHDICLLSGPVLFKYLLQSMSPDSKEPIWHGYSYAVAMFIIGFIQSILLHQYFRAQDLIGMNIRTAIISAVYRKSLRLSAASRGESMTGEITNLMSIDSQRFLVLMWNIQMLWSGPFQVSIGIYLLWQQLGPSVFAGVLILLVLISINTFIAWKSKVLQEKQLKTADKRIKLISEILNGIQAPWDIPEKKPPPQWPEGKIEFINYSTRYRKDLDFVLHSISVTIRPGEKAFIYSYTLEHFLTRFYFKRFLYCIVQIGIAGRTGSGKSSLVLALFRIIEASKGEICVDGINIAEIGLHDLRGRITLIPQDPVLFSGTLRFNLDPSNSYTDEAIWKALAVSNLRSFVGDASCEGLNMPIAEGGGNLSQGQRQLICLARALLRRSKILVLDEATAAVDPRTDEFIQQAVRKEFASSTVLTIAHRLNTILDYDRILVLDAGRLAEIGTPKELAKRTDSIFRGMLEEAGLLESVLGSSTN